ncbi:MAG: Crp/Fnr family transcriptional regulator [Bacteroidales bacterium]
MNCDESKGILKAYLNANSDLPVDDLEKIAGYFECKKLKKEHFLFEQGKHFPYLVFVVQGVLRSWIYDEQGREVVKTFVSDRHFLAEIDSFKRNDPCAFNISSVTDADLLLLSKTHYKQLRQEVPAWHLFFMQGAMEAMNSMIRREEFLKQGEAADKYAFFLEHFPNLAATVPLKYIASYLQINQSTLSRLRRKG